MRTRSLKHKTVELIESWSQFVLQKGDEY